MKIIFTLICALLASSPLSAVAPKKLYCYGKLFRANDSIPTIIERAQSECHNYGCDEESILIQYTDKADVLMTEEDFVCKPSHTGEVATCAVKIETEQVYMRYFFNTQGGGLILRDLTTGQVAETSWSQSKATNADSGFVSASVELKNYKGGLLGDQRVWEINARCYAKVFDF